MPIYHYTRFVDIRASITFASKNDKEKFIAIITDPSVTDGFSGYYTGEDFISFLSNRFKNDLDDDDPTDAMCLHRFPVFVVLYLIIAVQVLERLSFGSG